MDTQGLRENANYAAENTPTTKKEVLKLIAAIMKKQPVLSVYTEEDIFLRLD